MDVKQKIEDLIEGGTIEKEGYRKIIQYGICFYRKECFVMYQLILLI